MVKEGIHKKDSSQVWDAQQLIFKSYKTMISSCQSKVIKNMIQISKLDKNGEVSHLIKTKV